jgi:hypothetical protein
MKGGAENRKKTIMAGALGAVALCCVIYGYNALFGGSGPPPATSTAAPVTTSRSGPRRASNNNTSGSSSNSSSGNGGGNNPLSLGAAAGVAAQKMASTSSSLDPTLDESAMLRTESLVYSGSGRNIFSATYLPPVVLPTHVPSARPKTGPFAPQPFVPTGPPPPPPINLKFFGTAVRANGQHQVFLLQGEDVYLAAQGDIVARKYKIVSISSNNIQVEDLVNNDTQTLPLQQN